NPACTNTQWPNQQPASSSGSAYLTATSLTLAANGGSSAFAIRAPPLGLFSGVTGTSGADTTVTIGSVTYHIFGTVDSTCKTDLTNGTPTGCACNPSTGVCSGTIISDVLPISYLQSAQVDLNLTLSVNSALQGTST